MRNWPRSVLFLFCGLVNGVGMGRAVAQPSAAQVLRDVRGNGKGIISVKLVGRGSRVWSQASSQYVWDQSVVVVRQAGIKEFPKAKLEVGGIATYSIVGGRFPFKRFYVTYNSYSGIPAPSAKEVIALARANLPEVLSGNYISIVDRVQPLTLASPPRWDWHTPNSVSVRLTTAYKKKISDTQLQNTRSVFTVRLYRDAIKKPWTRIISTGSADETSLGVSTHDADALKAMKTLAVLDAERRAKTHLASLPAVSVPAFKTDLELFGFLHKTFRENNPKKGEAVLRRTLAPNFFAEGSDVLLLSDGEDLVQRVMKGVYGGKMSYAEQFPEDLNVSGYQTNWLSFWNADGKHQSEMRAVEAGGTWQNGQKVGQEFKIQSMAIYPAEGADEIARLRSMSPETRFAPPNGASKFSQLGKQVADQKNAQEQREVVRAIKWTPFTSNNARLTLAFPGAGTPKETEGQMNGKYPMWTLESSNDQVIGRAVSIIYPTTLNRMQAQTTVQSALTQLAAANNAQIKTRTEITDATYGQMATLQGDGSVMKVRVLAVGNVLYQLILSASPQTMANLSEREFFNSFQPLR